MIRPGRWISRTGEYNLEQQCINAKDEGIVVVTVAFDLNDQDTIDRLEGLRHL